ncbi:MAG: ATP-binding protein [Pseudomonadota bacterium]
MADISIKKRETLSFRLSSIIGLAIFLAVVTSSALVSWYGFKREIGQQITMLEGTAKVFSSTVAEAVANRDKGETKQVLTAIKKFPTFRFASVVNPDGSRFTEIGFDITLRKQEMNLDPGDVSSLLFKNDIWVEDKIIKAGELVGSLRLLADISAIKSGFFTNLIYNLAFAFASALAATMLSRYLVVSITNPIKKLSLLMTKLGEEATFSDRVEENGKGELLLLSQSFNRMLTDIENRDRQLLDYQTSLEQKVEDRTKDLVKAKDVAEHANAAKSEFLATMSHEIRTPMNGMLLMSELLATAELTPKHQRYADVIMKSGKSLLAIINDILDFSKIQSGKMELESVETNMQQLVEDVMSLFWQKAEEKQLDLACFIADDVPETFLADPTRLNQVLSNLVNNALKFTESGAVTITVNVIRDEQSGDYLEFAVNDTGIGIKQENLGKVFESFSQADQSTTRKFGGTGLGLPICKRLVEAMSGAIGVTSEYGKGTSFRFVIPASGVKNLPKIEAVGKSALVLLEDTDTTQVIIDALTQSAVRVERHTGSLDNSAEFETYDYIFGTSESLSQAPTLQPSQYGVAVTKLGETEIDGLVKGGKVHEILSAPLSSVAVRSVLERLVDGNPRAEALLEKSAAESNTLPSYEGAHILVVDDSAVNREVVIQALGRFDIHPVVVESGIEAIERFETGSFDLVLMDCSMPEMDGFEATRSLREIETANSSAPTPIIALTAHIVDHIAEQVKECGMNDVVVKPFTIRSIGNCLKEWLSPSDGVSVEQATPQKLTAETEDKVIDDALLDNLREISGDGFDTVMAQLHGLYLDNTPECVESIKSANQQEEYSKLSEAAHALKSMSFNIGAGKLGKLCSDLELEAKSTARDAELISDLVYSVGVAHHKVILHIKQQQNATNQHRNTAQPMAI